jgi:NADPH-dependent curcumin reductase CurA
MHCPMGDMLKLIWWPVISPPAHAAIDYKSEDVGKALRQHCPNGIDVNFDNVRGDILDAALANLARLARIVRCGDLAVQQHDAGQGPEQTTCRCWSTAPA